jgi:hypothetical protein
MIEHNSKVDALQAEVKKLAEQSLQAIYEIDGLCFLPHNILKEFTTEDWGTLKIQLSSWNSKQLEVLAYTLHNGDDIEESVEDNFFLPYIFTLADDSLASNLLNQTLVLFFEEHTIKSSELLDSMALRLNRLKEKGYLDENELQLWLTNIADNRLKL